MNAERVDRLRRWHEQTSADLHHRDSGDVEYLGLRLHVPATVFPPARMSELLGRAVLDETCVDDRVLDMGTGCGVNAILAARIAYDVVAVDVNPDAVESARLNCERHGVSDRVDCRVGDLFDPVDGRFDLVIFDPPFRWFAPQDQLEVAFADEDYRTLTSFFEQVGDRLRHHGRVLVFFGTTGDLAYLMELIAAGGMQAEQCSSSMLRRGGQDEEYVAFRLTR
jgi:release factor glutamine methyltransferase